MDNCMWAVFYTEDLGGDLIDHYLIVGNREAAQGALLDLAARPMTYCAGIGPVMAATEPQWITDGDDRDDGQMALAL